MEPLNPSISAISLLYVEDDQATRDRIISILSQNFPYLSILSAENGQVGLELYEEHRPDIVLTDINMPIMNGIQMARSIRALSSSANIIVATAFSDKQFLMDAIQIGITRYVLKPFDTDILFRAINDCIVQITMELQIKAQSEFVRKLSHVVEQSPNMIMIISARGNIEYINPKFTEITGYASDEVVGQRLPALMAKSPSLHAFEIIWNAISKGSVLHSDLTELDKDGEPYYEKIHISPLAIERGEITHYAAVLEDITERMQAREDTLKAQRLESIGFLAGGIAHDFNNILTGVLGNISLARFQLSDTEKVAKRLEDAEKAALRAKDLTQQLLTFARGGEPIKKIIPVGGLLKEAVDFVLHGANVRCEFDIADDLWSVEADEGQFVQVIHSLVLNAIQAMPQGGSISLAAKNVESESGRRFVTISGSDTGVGIPEHNMRKIFDPYFTTKQQGRGLGLTSSYLIIRKHDGKLRVTSTLGKGTAFKISLPAADKICEAKTATQSVLSLSQGSGRLLVMDDDEVVREISKAILTEFGYTVECVTNGEEAFQLYRRRMEEGTPFSVVILDLTIPGGIGGKETIKMLLEVDPNIKAIVSSGYSNDPVMANYREYGFSAVLSKPYRPREINELLQELLG